MRHVLSALVMNQPGVLAHISGMLASRAFNINSLAVGETENPEYQGAPAQYCLFERSGTLEIDMRRGGGPITLANQPSCISL